MNWDAISAIGEIVGATAVVVSLIYLAFQIRAQNLEARVAAIHEISVGFREVLTTMSTGDMAELFSSANEDYDSLTNAELIKLISGLYPILRVWEEAYIQFEKGRLEERLWVAMNSQFCSYLAYPAFNRVWNLRHQHFDKKFQEFVGGQEVPEVHLR